MSGAASSVEDDLGSYATAVAVVTSQFGALVAVSCFAGNTRKSSLERRTQKRIYQFYGFCQESHGCQMAITKFLDCMYLALWA